LANTQSIHCEVKYYRNYQTDTYKYNKIHKARIKLFPKSGEGGNPLLYANL